MLRTETAQDMYENLHKPTALENGSASEMTVGQTVLNKALEHPMLLAPPPTPVKQRLQTPSENETSSEPPSPNFPDHLRCGEVFTWHCEGEFYAVECRLCDDHPLCPLSEFPLHMEAWHTDWSGKLTIDGEDMDDEDDDDEDQNDLYHVLALSPLNEDSGLCDYDHEHNFESSSPQLSPASSPPSAPLLSSSFKSSSSHEEDENVLEPFEQVLIEQDSIDNTAQINQNEGVDEEMRTPPRAAARGNKATRQTVLATAEASPSLPSHEDELEQHRTTPTKQYNLAKKQINSNEHENEISEISATNPLMLSPKKEKLELTDPIGRATAEEAAHSDDKGDNRELRELREYLVCLNNEVYSVSEIKKSPHSEEANDYKEKPEDTTAEITGIWNHTSNYVGHLHNDEAAKESYNNNNNSNTGKQEIPAGEMAVIRQQQQSAPADLQHLDISFTNFQETTKANEVERQDSIFSEKTDPILAPSLEIERLGNPTNVATTTVSRSKRGRKRKCLPKEERVIKSKTPTATQQTIDCNTYSVLTPQNSPNSEVLSSPKRRRIYSRACKKHLSTDDESLNYQSKEGLKNAKTSSLNAPTKKPECNGYSFPSPPTSHTDSTSPEMSTSHSDKASKIRYLVKQCERIAREHQSSASSVSSSGSTTIPNRATSGRRRSLTPVEVCDILPTVPLNDHNISIYDTGNMSPQALSEHLESLACSLLDYDDFPDEDGSVASTNLNIVESSPSSPGSPKTEEEHFEFHEPKEKLNRTHVLQLIELYKEHTRLWDQTHTEFCEPALCRKSWEEIAACWNVFCNRNFTVTEVRIRISTLCQRYIKERERIQREGELEESAKFPYFEQMSFLEQNRSLQKRREVYEQQNEQIIEIYKKYLVLWHVRCYKVRQVKERTKAYQSISAELKDMGIYLSSTGVQKRIRSLRKCYRLEKIRHLHAQVERLKFESTFKHYERMQFLDKHIDPFVCRICGKIFESLVGFKEHLETANHGNVLEEEDDEVVTQTMQQRPNMEAQSADAVLCATNEKFEISMNTKDPNSVSVFIKPLAIGQEVEIYASETGCDTLNRLPMDDIIIEEIIENVTNEDAFATKSLDTYLHLNDDNENRDASFYVVSDNNNSANLDLEKTMRAEAEAATEVQNVEEPKTNKEVIPILDAKSKYTKKINGADEDYHSGDGDSQSVRLSDDEIRSLIGIYRKYRQLWDPNDLDFNSRQARRQAWLGLTSEFNKAQNRNFSWRSLYRKLIDYAKYYKKLTTEQNTADIKWIFYQDLMFLDDVLSIGNELSKAIHQPETTLKLIEIYRDIPQLWHIRDPDFNKRPIKQRNIHIMCTRLQEETNQPINPERIKNRLIELRTHYRTDKKKRLKCQKTKQKFFPAFEYYDQFSFIDAHIDPFECDLCNMDFKRLTDFNRHMRKEHEPKKRRFRNVEDNEYTQVLDNICHICGVKFSNRGNLGHHLLRHQGIRNFECSFCPKKFFTSHSLKIHVRTHTKECPYICEKCGLSFVNASKLNQHVLRHTNQKDFKCDHCPKAFYTAFERDRHTRWHLNIRDKICPICGKSFVKGSSYYAHLMLHSDKKRFECEECDRKFAQYAGLYKHRKRYHSN